MTIKIKLKDRKTAKTPGAQEVLRRVCKIINIQFNTPENKAVMAEAFMLGTPVMVYGDGKIEVVKDYYKTEENPNGLDKRKSRRA